MWLAAVSNHKAKQAFKLFVLSDHIKQEQAHKVLVCPHTGLLDLSVYCIKLQSLYRNKLFTIMFLRKKSVSDGV